MRSGDGWATCRAGHRHWGVFGAAGLLLVEHRAVLLQLRSHHTHHGGTWSIPGGARNDPETAEQAALREAREEIGVRPSQVRPVGEYVDDHGGWAYTTVVAAPRSGLTAVHNVESSEVRWFPLAEVAAAQLHPGFRASWAAVAEVVRSLLPVLETPDA